LGDGGQCELKLGSVRPTQSQPAEPEDAFQMREQHLNTLSFATRLLLPGNMGVTFALKCDEIFRAFRKPAQCRKLLSNLAVFVMP
jgi:hypothetical protein